MPTIPIRWSDNTKELARNLKEGLNQIEATRASVEKLVQAFKAEGLIANAHKWTAAIAEMGGVAKLSGDQQARAFRIVGDAISALERQGRPVPAQMRQLQKELKAVQPAGEGMTQWLGKANGLLTTFGLGLSAAAAVGFGKTIVSTLSQIQDLYQATGVSRDALQRLGYVGSEVGVDMDTMGRAVEELSKRLASGDASATGAAQKLGLNLKALIAAGPLESFLQIGEAIGKVADPMQKGALSADAFGGKLGKVLIPMLGNLRQAINDVPKDALFTDKDIEDADAFGDAIGHIVTKLEAYTVRAARAAKDGLTSIFGTAEDERRRVADTYGGSFAPDDAKDINLLPAKAANDTISNADLVKNALNALRASALEPLSAWQKQNIAELAKWGQNEKEIATLVGASEQAVHLYAEALKASEAATKKQNEALKQFNKSVADATSFLKPFWDVLNTIDGTVVEASKSLLAHGAKVEDVARMYGLTDGQIAAVVAQMKLEQTVVDATGASYGQLTAILKTFEAQRRSTANAALSTNLSATVGAERSAVDTRNKLYLTSYEYQVSLIQREAEERKTGLDKTGAYYSQALAAIEDDTKVKMDGAAQAWQTALAEMDNETGTFLKTIGARLAGIPGLFQQALTGGGGYAGATKAIFSGLGADIGVEAFAGIARKLSSKFASTFGTKTTELLGSIIPGIGGLIGSLAGPLIEKFMGLFGPSKLEKEGRKAAEAYMSGFDDLADMLQKFSEARQALGDDVGTANQKARQWAEELYAAELRGGDAVQRVIDKIKESMDAAAKQADLLREASSLYGPSSTDLQASADKAREMFDAMLKAGTYTQEQLDKAYRAYQQAMADAGDAAAKAWLEANKLPEDFAELAKQAGYQSQAELQKAADKARKLAEYMRDSGLYSADAVKDAFEKADDAAMAALGISKKVRDELEALRKGVEAEAPEEEMGSIEREARKRIEEIEKQMEAARKAAAENGEAQAETAADTEDTADRMRTSMGDAVFDIQEYFKRTGQTAQTTADAITAAFRDLKFDIPVTFSVGPTPSGPTPSVPAASTGGLVVPGGLQRFAGGGSVLNLPTIPSAPWPDTQLVWAAPGEIIMNPLQQTRLADTLRSAASLAHGVNAGRSTGEPVNVNNHVDVYLDGERVTNNVITRVSQNKRGAGTRLRRGLASEN